MNTGSSLNPALNGEVTYDGEFARLYYQRRLAHSPQKIWAALTDPAQLSQWFTASSVAIDGRPGGSFETVAGPSVAKVRARGKILTWAPPRVFEYEWIADPIAGILPLGENAVVRWQLAPIEGGTLLTLEHRKLHRKTSIGFAPGWHTFLDRLAAQLDGDPLPDWAQRFDAAKINYPGWEN